MEQNLTTTESENNTNGFREFLKQEFLKRKSRNEIYSARAFSRDLSISPTCLSDVMAGKRNLSRRNAIIVANKLNLTPKLTNTLLNQLGYKADKKFEADEFYSLNEKTFSMISDWYYFPLLSLCDLKEVPVSLSGVAQRLGIAELEVANAIDKLLMFNFIVLKDGFYIRDIAKLSTSRDVPSKAIRDYHKQNLQMAARSLEDDPVDLRDISSITFTADINKLKEAKELIFDFKRKIGRLLETENATEVYTLAIQLFPLSKSIEGRENE